MKNEPIIIERLLNVLVQKVWDALTINEQMKKWYFNLESFKPEVGFEFRFDGGPEDRVYHHVCKITQVIPMKKLSYSWRYEGYEGNTGVSFELFDENGKTRLKLTHTGLENFPDNPDFAKHNFVEGWTQIVGTSLKNFVEK